MSVLLAPQPTDTPPSDLPEIEPDTRRESPADMGIRVRRLTRQEFRRMAAQGFFRPDEKLELIEGELIEPMGENPPHASAIRRCRVFLERIFEPLGAFLSIQSPITIAEDTEPEPDLAVVRGVLADFDRNHPAPANLLLIVEVSDTTLMYDRSRKGPLYAAAAIPEYWIVNLSERRLEVFRTPLNGSYQVILSLAESQTIAPLASPDYPISVADLLPAPMTP